MSEDTVTIELATEGMHCMSCGKLIEMTLGQAAGVSQVSADYETGKTVITYDPAVISPADLIAKIEGLGYRASEKT